MEYNIDYFIKKFSAIPENKWFIGGFSNIDNTKRCAVGHCCDGTGEITEESSALLEIGKKYKLHIPSVNDGTLEGFSFWIDSEHNNEKYFHLPTPKERILAALNDIKALETKEQEKVAIIAPKREIRYVKVPQSIDNLTKELILN